MSAPCRQAARPWRRSGSWQHFPWGGFATGTCLLRTHGRGQVPGAGAHPTAEAVWGGCFDSQGKSHGNDCSPVPIPACTCTPKGPRPRCVSQGGQEPISPFPRQSGAALPRPGAGGGGGKLVFFQPGSGLRSDGISSLASVSVVFRAGRPASSQDRMPSRSQEQHLFLFKAIVSATFPMQKPEAGARNTYAIYFVLFFKGSPACKKE